MGTKDERDSVATTIRAFGEADAAAAAEILRASPEAARWTEWGLRELLGCKVSWRWSAETAVRSVVSSSDASGREAEILNLAVIPAKRRKGEGGALLKAAVEALRARKVSRVFLEVRESNEAGMAFYEKQGFSKTGRRAGYYRDSG